MNFFETCHGQCGYPQGSPQPVSKIWDDFHFHDFMGSPLWSLELDLWIIYWKNPKGGPHEIMKMKILPDLWYLLWWTLSVPTLFMTSFKINHYWKGWNAPKSVYRLKSRYLLFPSNFKLIDLSRIVQLVFFHRCASICRQVKNRALTARKNEV